MKERMGAARPTAPSLLAAARSVSVPFVCMYVSIRKDEVLNCIPQIGKFRPPPQYAHNREGVLGQLTLPNPRGEAP